MNLKFLNMIILFFCFNSYLMADNYGRLLLYGNCITCHHETKNISAPSLQIIQQRYKEAFIDKKAFVEYMSTWVLNPDKKTSIMYDMIEKYELMPQLGYDKDTLEKISHYIYEMNIE